MSLVSLKRSCACSVLSLLFLFNSVLFCSVFVSFCFVLFTYTFVLFYFHYTLSRNYNDILQHTKQKTYLLKQIWLLMQNKNKEIHNPIIVKSMSVTSLTTGIPLRYHFHKVKAQVVITFTNLSDNISVDF